MLATALRRLDEIGTAKDKVYAVEKPNRSREFHIMTPEAVWERTRSSERSHMYEVLTGPCNLYLDIEWYAAAAPADEKDKVRAIVKHVVNALNTIYKEPIVTVTTASASGHVAKGKYKCSWHVHMSCSTICWANAAAVGNFVRSECAGIPEVDKVPYAGTGQNWRCVGSSKITDPMRRLSPVDYSTFVGCTVQQPIGGRSLVYPVATIPSQPTEVPDHILCLAETLQAGGTPVMCGPDRCIVPFRELQVCEHAQRKHRSNHQYAVINTRTLLWKMNCHSCADEISVWRAFPDMCAVKVAFDAQTKDYAASAPVPPRKIQSQRAPDVINVHYHGPPPSRSGTVLCVDGLYHNC